MSAHQIALLRFGYDDYAVPVTELSEVLVLLGKLRKVEREYSRSSTTGYVYWYAGDSEQMDVTLLSSSRILDAKPDEQAPAAVAPPPAAEPDDRVIAAPTDVSPIFIKSVPPMREFVDEWRDGSAA